MDQRTEAIAGEVAEELVTTFGFVTILSTLISVIYGGFQLWSFCHGNTSNVQADLVSQYNTDTNNFSRAMMQKARIRVKRAARREGVRYDDDQLDILTRTMLRKAMSLTPEDAEHCCTALRSEPLPKDEHDTDFS